MIFGLCAATGLRAVDTNDTKMLTKPAVSAERIAFVYANDLWTADLEGRNVRRLTADVGTESDPAFSPDGRLVAFSGQYDGNVDVYVVPAGGRRPQAPDLAPGGRHRPGLHARRPVGPVRLGPLLQQPRLFPALHRARRGRRSRHAQGPLRLRRRDLPRRPAHRLLPLSRGLQPVEELPRRPLLAHLDLRRRGRRASRSCPSPRAARTTSTRCGSAARSSSAPTATASSTCSPSTPRPRRSTQLTEFKDFPVLSASAGAGKVVFEQAGSLHLYDVAQGKSRRLTDRRRRRPGRAPRALRQGPAVGLRRRPSRRPAPGPSSSSGARSSPSRPRRAIPAT
ncbi:MAG: hypothetical protein M0C28_45060 [Candidatus Moduliflexus flocculans]|nr:hypothetical protein [Candidatus Moduliflexus flocculans]